MFRDILFPALQNATNEGVPPVDDPAGDTSGGGGFDLDPTGLQQFAERRQRMKAYDGVTDADLAWQGLSSTPEIQGAGLNLQRMEDTREVGDLMMNLDASDLAAMPPHLRGILGEYVAQGAQRAVNVAQDNAGQIRDLGLDPQATIAAYQPLTDPAGVHAAINADTAVGLHRGYGDRIQPDAFRGPTPTFPSEESSMMYGGYRNPSFGMPQQHSFGFDVGGAVGRGLRGAWNSLGQNNAERLQMLGGVGGGIMNYLNQNRRNDMLDRQIGLQEQIYGDQRDDEERRREEWREYLRRNGLGG